MIVCYTLLGGFRAVVWTDVIQALLIVAALAAVPAILISGPSGQHVYHRLLGIQVLDLAPVAAISGLAWGLGYVGQPHILARFMALGDPADTPKARRIATAWTTTSLAAAVAVGIAGAAFPATAELVDPEKIFLELIGLLLNPFFAGLCLAAVFAAIMSTADSQLLVAATTLAYDSRDPTKFAERPASSGLGSIRVAVAALAVVAAALATYSDQTVLGLVSYAWAGFGASFGPALLMTLLWAPTTAAGVFAGMVGGGITVAVWHFMPPPLTDLYELVPAFAVATVLIVAVSLASGGAAEVDDAK